MVAALAGFFLCYFLSGTTRPPRSPAAKMTLIAPLPKPRATNQAPLQFPSRILAPQRQVVHVPVSFGIKERPELIGYQKSSLKLDLMSSRYRAEVDLSDLQ